jgi:hypothetical protein
VNGAARLGLLLCTLVTPSLVPARSLEQALASTFPGALREDGEGLATVFSRTVAASFPITGTSASYAYRFDPATDSFQRSNIPLGPVFSERAETVGPRRLSLGVNYLLVQYDTIEGHDLNALVSNDPNTGADHIAICTGSPQDPQTVCEPVQAVTRLDLEAQIVTLSATYGVTPDLDINAFLPLVRTFLRAHTTFTGPDPRVPSDDDFFDFNLNTSASETSTGVGDLLLRVKYVLVRDAPFDLAGGLTLSLPTGDRADFQGTGDTLVGAALYASRTYGERVQPHLNLSFVLDADKFDRSQVRYSLGADLRVFDWLTLNNDFLGRSDIAQGDEIARPVFVQLERADVLQFSTGLKIAPPWRVAIRDRGLPWVWFFNALLPLNDDGVRADVILAFGLEAVF